MVIDWSVLCFGACLGSGVGEHSAVQRGKGIRAHFQRHRRNGSFNHGRHHYELRSRFRPHYGCQRRLSRSIGHGENASHLSRFRWSRGICTTTSYSPFLSLSFHRYYNFNFFVINYSFCSGRWDSRFNPFYHCRKHWKAKAGNRSQ